MIKDVVLQKSENNTLLLSDVIEKLKSFGYKFENGAFFYYSLSNDILTHCGEAPPNETYLPLADVGRRLVLRWRHVPMAEPRSAPAPSKEHGKKSHTKRNKERKIGEVVEKVSEWRRLYTGRIDKDGKVQKLSLDDAAKEIGIAKKTLDDYLLQLRAGKKYNFDFNEHKDDKVGILRAFVKERKVNERSHAGEGSNGLPSNGQDGVDSIYGPLPHNETP